MMRTPSAALLATVVAVSALAMVGPAPDADAQVPPRVTIPAQGPIQIDMSALPMIPPEPPPTAFEQALNAIGDLRTRVEEFHKARTAYKRALESCGTRSYSQKEMAAAGCAPNDTVAACSRKLLYACIMTARRPMAKLSDAAFQAEAKLHGRLPGALAVPEPPQP